MTGIWYDNMFLHWYMYPILIGVAGWELKNYLKERRARNAWRKANPAHARTDYAENSHES